MMEYRILNMGYGGCLMRIKMKMKMKNKMKTRRGWRD